MPATTRHRAPGGFTEEQLRAYADTWRDLARTWARVARDMSLRPTLATRFRRTAQTALFAAHEADELARQCIAESGRPPRGARELPRAPWDHSPPPAPRASDGLPIEWLRRPARVASTR